MMHEAYCKSSSLKFDPVSFVGLSAFIYFAIYSYTEFHEVSKQL